MIKDNYLYNIEYNYINELIPQAESVYIYGYSTEERSHCVDDLKNIFSANVTFIQIEESGKDRFRDLNSTIEYNLRSSSSILQFFELYKTTCIYLDVTGLNNRISASLLKNAFELKNSFISPEIRVIYVEPETYTIARFKAEGVLNDLSEQIDGIEPLPGFASIIPGDSEDEIFVVLLGFEGGRFTHLIENIQPQKDTITPVIGVPGFRLEYPFAAYWGNRRSIKDTEAWRNVKYIGANSIVDIYIYLTSLLVKNPDKKIKVAPIGTKPHAIGAILFAIKNFDKVELIYDNPIRKTTRTVGAGKIIECKVCKLLDEK